jgi:ATP-GRASP peptide maturase of grasp-with-spasm system
MILIFSEVSDQSTNKIIDWLSYYDQEYIRVNEDTPVDVLHFDFSTTKMVVNIKGRIIDSSQIKGYWYRRGLIPIKTLKLTNKRFSSIINNIFRKDQATIRNFIYSFFEQAAENTVGSFFNSSLNKLYQLRVANQVGLNIPSTFITNNFSSLNPKKEYITKSFSDVFEKFGSNKTIMNYTNEISINDERFFASLIQEKIHKLYEIRIFYLKEKCYSMAIFSQNNKKTEIDFRHYDKQCPNRYVPYKIPSSLETSIIAFMRKLNLNTGSLDFIYSKKRKYVFLEVNPVGQFGMVSYPCNYQLEKIVAETLIK